MKAFGILTAVLLASGGVRAADHPEITWSVMHPTAVDTNYMARVVDCAKAYGGVDSFEVCGDCHSAYGGVNGLSMLDPYPKAHALVDSNAVLKARAELNEVVRLAHSAGARLYYWHREIFVPKGLLEDVPSLRDADGEFDPLGMAYRDYLRFKIDETFRYVPGLDGLVLTLTEAEFSVIHNSNPKRYPPEEVVAQLVGLFAEEHEKRGKRFCLRSFGSTTWDYEVLVGGARRASTRHRFEIETKITEADFVPFLPINPFLVRQPGLTLAAECDALGEFLGAGYLPAAHVARIREYVGAARARGVGRYAIRIDRVGNSIFDSAHEVNLAAYMRFARDPLATTDEVLSDYAARRFGCAVGEMKNVLSDELGLVRDVQYVASNLVFHSLPVQCNLRTTKAGAIFSVYREGASLVLAKNVWSIFDARRAPAHRLVLFEKRRGRETAERGLATIERLKERLPADEFARQRRAFANAVKVARAQEAFAACCVAYFEDMVAQRDEPTQLRAAVAAAERTISAEMTDPNECLADGGYHFAVVGNNIDRAFLAGLRFHCTELLREYAAERQTRRELGARAEVLDFVVPGGIYDDNRTGRSAMHAAYAKILDGRLVRWAGNPEHPNGTLTVEFRDVPGATVEVALAPEGAAECTVTESVRDGVRTVVVGKKGVDYPAVRHIALVGVEFRNSKVRGDP